MRPDLGEHLYRNKKFLDLLAGKTLNFCCPMQVCKAAEGLTTRVRRKHPQQNKQKLSNH
jgi:hypothetical protein